MAQKSKIPFISLYRYFGAVEIAFTSREQSVINITICRKRKGKLMLIEQLQNLPYHQAAPIIKKLNHYYLIITGKVVIHKNFPKTYDETSDLGKPILPDANLNEFCTQTYILENEYCNATIRKEILERILRGMAADKYYPDTIYIGSIINTIFPNIIGKQNFTLHTTNTSMEFLNSINNEIVYENNEQSESYFIGNDEIHSFNVPGICACLNTELKLIKDTAIESLLARSAMEEARNKKKFKLNLFYAVGIMLFVICINFLANKHYSNKHALLDEELNLNKQSLVEIEKMEKNISEKKSLLGNRTYSNGPVISIMTDQIGAGIPENIRIFNLEIFPLAEKVQKEKPITFGYNKILAQGYSLNAKDVDQWLDKCKNYKWVKDVSLVNYYFDNNLNKGVFKIELFL